MAGGFKRAIKKREFLILHPVAMAGGFKRGGRLDRRDGSLPAQTGGHVVLEIAFPEAQHIPHIIQRWLRVQEFVRVEKHQVSGGIAVPMQAIIVLGRLQTFPNIFLSVDNAGASAWSAGDSMTGRDF